MATTSRAIRQELGRTLKKDALASERDEQTRGALRRCLSGLDPRRLVFVEKWSANVKRVSLTARAPKMRGPSARSQKLERKCHADLLNLLGGCEAVDEHRRFRRREVFLLYVEHFLCPSLKRSQRITVIDNLQVHKL